MATVTLAPPGVAATSAWADRFTGTWQLVRLAARRDRVLVPVWWAVFVFMTAFSAEAVIGLYPTEAERVAASEQVNLNPAMLAMFGPITDPTSIGQLSMFKMTAMGAAMLGLLSVILMVRHTRADEEAGRTELVGAGVLGRWAPLAAGCVAVVVTNVVLVTLVALGLVAAGLDLVGSLSFAVAWLVTGLTFAGVAAVSAQLMSTPRSATGAAAGVLGLAYLVRAVADGSPDGDLAGLRWMSPIGWTQEVHAFGDIRWGVAGLGVAAAVALMAAAFALVERRDLGAGMLPDRAGRAHGGRTLASPVGLAVRLHRATVIGWALLIALFSQAIGGMITDLGGLLEGNAAELITALGGQQAIEDAFLAAELSFLGVFLAAFAVAATLRVRGEEGAGRAEPVLATPVGRVRWAFSHVTVALAGASLLLLVAGVGIGFGTWQATDDAAWWGKSLSGALVQLPAIAVLVGIALLAVGLAPRIASAISWGALTTFFLLGELGPILELPTWLMDLSPFAHTPRLPGVDVVWMELVGLSVVAVALLVAGAESIRRRDLTA